MTTKELEVDCPSPIPPGEYTVKPVSEADNYVKYEIVEPEEFKGRIVFVPTLKALMKVLIKKEGIKK